MINCCKYLTAITVLKGNKSAKNRSANWKMGSRSYLLSWINFQTITKKRNHAANFSNSVPFSIASSEWVTSFFLYEWKLEKKGYSAILQWDLHSTIVNFEEGQLFFSYQENLDWNEVLKSSDFLRRPQKFLLICHLLSHGPLLQWFMT